MASTQHTSLAHPLMVLIMAVAAVIMLRISQVKLSILAPVVLVLCVIGAYAVNNTMNGVYVLLIFGVVGYALVKPDSRSRRSSSASSWASRSSSISSGRIMTDDDPWLFITRPISGGLLLVAVISVVLSIWQHMRHARRTATVEPDF